MRLRGPSRLAAGLVALCLAPLGAGCGGGGGGEVPASTSTEQTQQYIQNPFGTPGGEPSPAEKAFLESQPPK